MKRAAIIGFGTIGPVHGAAILANPEIRLCAVCDINPAVREKVPDGVAFYTDYEEMCEQVRPDVVHVCLPHYLHVPVSEYFAERGINVFCEKPVAMKKEEAYAFAAFEAAHPNVHMGICLQNRLNETTRVLKEIVDSGRCGRIIGVRGYVPWARTREYYEEQPWRGTWQYAGGGCMINQSVHTLDLMYYICGPIVRLHSSVSHLLDYDIEVEDTVSARLEFENGARGVFMATNCNYTNESIELRVALEKGTFEIRNDILWEVHPDNTMSKLAENEKMPGAKFYFGASHSRLINKFYRALEENTEDYIHVKDAVMSIRLIDAIHESSAAGAAVTV